MLLNVDNTLSVQAIAGNIKEKSIFTTICKFHQSSCFLINYFHHQQHEFFYLLSNYVDNNVINFLKFCWQERYVGVIFISPFCVLFWMWLTVRSTNCIYNKCKISVWYSENGRSSNLCGRSLQGSLASNSSNIQLAEQPISFKNAHQQNIRKQF